MQARPRIPESVIASDFAETSKARRTEEHFHFGLDHICVESTVAEYIVASLQHGKPQAAFRQRDAYEQRALM